MRTAATTEIIAVREILHQLHSTLVPTSSSTCKQYIQYSAFVYIFSVLFKLWNSKPIVIAIDLFTFRGFFSVFRCLHIYCRCCRTSLAVYMARIRVFVSCVEILFPFRNLSQVVCLRFGRIRIMAKRFTAQRTLYLICSMFGYAEYLKGCGVEDYEQQ